MIDIIMLQEAISKVLQKPTHAGERLNIHVEDYIENYNMCYRSMLDVARCPEKIHFYEITLVAVVYAHQHKRWLRWSIDI